MEIASPSAEASQGQPFPRFLQPPVPTVFTLEITPRCQLHCRGCGNVFSHDPHTTPELDAEAWHAILERLRPLARALRITGGEPTLHPQFDAIIRQVDVLGVPFVVFTNGQWPNPVKVIRILRSARHLRGILVSMHGDDAESYSCYTGSTGSDDFLRLTAHIRQAAAAGLRVVTNTLLLRTTIDRLAEIAHLAFNLGVSGVSFGRYYGVPLPDLTPDADALRSALRQIATLRRNDPRITLSNCVPICFLPDTDFGGRGCTSGFTHATIGPQGDVRPCTHTALTLGNIHHGHDQIEALWQSPALEAWRRAVPETCWRCAALSRCKGGCRATARQLNLPHDSLMSAAAPLETYPPAWISTVTLNDSDCPRLVCTVEQTSYGYTLTGTGHFVTLSLLSGPILHMLDGHTTVAQLRERFGPIGLQVVANLLMRRLATVR